VLPRIELHARIAFRDVRCPHARADFIAETVGLSFRWWLRLKQRGKRPEEFVSAIAAFAARAARSGRRVCGHEKAKDILSPVAQRTKGFSVGRLPDFSTLSDNPLAEALADNTLTPVDEQACFRIDWPAFERLQTQRDRHLLRDMMRGEGTKALALIFHISEARVSQKRREFKEAWDAFTGGAA
jgi:hypothetical protein